MSMPPRNRAPSAMATLGAVMSPSTEPLSRIATLSVALMSPKTSPSTMTDFANTPALIRPCGPIVRTCCLSSILPSTCPSMVRSSLPLSSPLITTDLPMFTTSRSATRPPARDAPTPAPVTLAAAAGLTGFAASSRFHITASPRHLVGRTASRARSRPFRLTIGTVYESPRSLSTDDQSPFFGGSR